MGDIDEQLKARTMRFSLDVCALIQRLPNGEPGWTVQHQLAKAATSVTRLPNHPIRVRRYPFSTGRFASEDHSDHEPAYSFAPVRPACSNASRLWQAVTPDPQ